MDGWSDKWSGVWVEEGHGGCMPAGPSSLIKTRRTSVKVVKKIETGIQILKARGQKELYCTDSLSQERFKCWPLW